MKRLKILLAAGLIIISLVTIFFLYVYVLLSIAEGGIIPDH